MDTGERAFLGRGWAFPRAHAAPDGEIALAEYDEDVHAGGAARPRHRPRRARDAAGLRRRTAARSCSSRSPTTTRALVAHRVREALVRCEPRIDVLDVPRRARSPAPTSSVAGRGGLPGPRDEHLLQPRLSRSTCSRGSRRHERAATRAAPRRAARLRAADAARRRSCPGWQPAPGGAGRRRCCRVYAQFLRRARRSGSTPRPDKNELAFLDLLGLDVLAAQAARAPVVFSHDPAGAATAARRPGTRLGGEG